MFLTVLCSIGGAFGGNRGLRPVPPEKGIFPLDHLHLCDIVCMLVFHLFIHSGFLISILIHSCIALVAGEGGISKLFED